jgi:hypothetical protein
MLIVIFASSTSNSMMAKIYLKVKMLKGVRQTIRMKNKNKTKKNETQFIIIVYKYKFNLFIYGTR